MGSSVSKFISNKSNESETYSCFSSSTSMLKPCIEKLMFQPPTPSYGRYHPKLTFVGSNVACMWNTVKHKSMIILYAHGNACDIGNVDPFLEKLSKTVGVNIISYDYEGYGLTVLRDASHCATEKGTMRATETVFYDYLIRALNIAPSRIILYGTSIGTGPMIKLAANLAESGIHVGGIILQTPYTSILGVGIEMICGSGAESLESTCDNIGKVVDDPNVFTSYKDITKIKSPITILHGKNDEVIPYENAVRLHQLTKQFHSKLITLPITATHNNIENVPEHFEIVANAIREFL